MDSRNARIDTGMSVSFIISTVIHLAVFLLFITWEQLFPATTTIEEAYYVDVVTLPVAEPQSGAPVQNSSITPVVLPPPAVVPPISAPPASPKTSKLKANSQQTKTVAPQEAAVTESSFAERMAKLEKNNEIRHEEAVLEKLRNKVKTGSNSKSGMPGSDGAEAGSRYADFVKSRLEDALRVTSSYTTKNPQVAVRIAIAADGRLLRMKIERTNGDATFELAVRRAIDLASEKFTPPPNRTVFENGFLFKPKGISNSSPR